ncbi:MAG: hypothetical protein AAF191_21325 [Verrucomicrobiota bacterium]
MPRKSKSGISTGQVIGLVGGIAFLLVVAGLVLVLFLAPSFGGKGDGTPPRHTRVAATELRVQDYYENANTLLGNAYRVTGRVEEQLRWSANQGRLISLLVSGSSSSPVPILIPVEFGHLNVEKGAQFTFVVEVRNNGLLVATDVKTG